jgi:2-methylaconitate cis-trans-isomerase PrpF
MGITGYETPEELDSNKELFEKLEQIREEASQAMGLGSCKGNVIPKIAAVSAPQFDGDMNIRYFTPTTAHPAIAVSAGFCIAVGSFIKGTILNQINTKELELGGHIVKIENPSGTTEVGVNFPTLDINDVEGMTTRTARLLFEGEVYV